MHTPWKEPELRICVKTDVHLNLIFIGQDVVGQGLRFRFGERLGSCVSVGAGILGTATSQPFEIKVAVGVGAGARERRLVVDYFGAQLLQNRIVQNGVFIETSQSLSLERFLSRFAEDDIIRLRARFTPHPVFRVRIHVTI